MTWDIENLITQLKVIKNNVPELKFFGEKPLHSKSEDVDLEEGLLIAQKLKEVVLKYRKITGLGRGVAAPQIGIQKNVFIAYLNDEFKTYINPSITNSSQETNFYRELCMSSSVLWSDVERSESILMKWMDEMGKIQESNFDSFSARLIQHEIDHLNGCVCLDKAIPGTISFVPSSPFEEKIRKERL